MDKLTRSFGAVRAVDGISFEVRQGEVLSIIGPNGSGKTTTINLLSGLIPHEGGTIALGGKSIDRLSAEQRSELGISRTFQNGRVFANMTVADNVYVGMYVKLIHARPWGRLRHLPVLRWASLLGELALALVQPSSVKREQVENRAEIDLQLARFGDRLSGRSDHPAYSLSYANRRRTEIARALASHPRLLLLDEPTAGMNQTETAEVLAQLLELKRHRHTLVLVEHKIDLVMMLSDRVIVMDNGRIIAEGSPAEIRNDEQVIEAYLGRRRARETRGAPAATGASDLTPPQPVTTGPLLELRGIDVFYGAAHALHEVSLHVAAGEIVSLLGGNASGKSTTMKAVLGLVKPKRGQVLLDGQPADGLSTAERVRRGVASVPEARRVFPNMTIEENLLAGAFTRSGHREIKHDLERMFESFPRLAERRTQSAGTLSGGEQQMLAFARALMSRPRLICMDEPTMGLSPLFVERVLEMIVDINARLGVAVLMVEQNAELALSIAGRGYVLQTGSIVLEG
ncbi:MAG: ATP-binding cassette domain-containing protein, partial [Chloroflexota bacterium]|nr:ATP-binding cassette domain-containing protein [Chloroflexota bacterium]